MRLASILVSLLLITLIVSLVGQGGATMMPFFGHTTWLVPSLAVAAMGAIAGAPCTVMVVTFRRVDAAAVRGDGSATITISLVIISVLLFAAVGNGAPPAKTATALLMATVGLIAGQRFIEALLRGDAVGWRTYWGGLGSGGSGFTFLPSTTLLILSVVFLSAAAIIAMGLDPVAPPRDPATTASVVASPPRAKLVTAPAQTAHPTFGSGPNTVSAAQ